MHKNKSVAVVIPCYDEESQIHGVLETIPDFVDAVIVVDDRSKDKTVEVVEQFIEADGGQSSRVTLIRHENNKGVGAAIATGSQSFHRE